MCYFISYNLPLIISLLSKKTAPVFLKKKSVPAFLYRSSIFLTKIGKIIYPSYEITRHAVIYQDRDDVIKYDMANQNLCLMDDAIARKNFDEAQEIYEKVYIQFIEALKKLANNDHQLLHVSFFVQYPLPHLKL